MELPTEYSHLQNRFGPVSRKEILSSHPHPAFLALTPCEFAISCTQISDAFSLVYLRIGLVHLLAIIRFMY